MLSLSEDRQRDEAGGGMKRGKKLEEEEWEIASVVVALLVTRCGGQKSIVKTTSLALLR